MAKGFQSLSQTVHGNITRYSERRRQHRVVTVIPQNRRRRRNAPARHDEMRNGNVKYEEDEEHPDRQYTGSLRRK